jgi:hypothetical protein
VHFRNMIKLLNPDALVPKADTIKNDIMETFEEERKKRKVLLQVNTYMYKNNFKIFLKLILYILIEYSGQNFICTRCMDIN